MLEVKDREVMSDKWGFMHRLLSDGGAINWRWKQEPMGNNPRVKRTGCAMDMVVDVPTEDSSVIYDFGLLERTWVLGVCGSHMSISDLAVLLMPSFLLLASRKMFMLEGNLEGISSFPSSNEPTRATCRRSWHWKSVSRSVEGDKCKCRQSTNKSPRTAATINQRPSQMEASRSSGSPWVPTCFFTF